MATVERLSAIRVAKLSKPGMYADGKGLYLQVTGTAAKSWIFRYSLTGKAREMGLGSLSALSLADARLAAAKCRAQRQTGVDPIEARNAERAQAALEAAKALTFSEAAERYIAAHESAWRNEKHRHQWRSTLKTYAEPVFGALSVQAVDTALVLEVLEPIWNVKRETASRLRGRIEAVLDWAKARGLRQGENPAGWRGHLKHLLADKAAKHTVRHHPALPYRDVPTFIAALQTQENIAALALEFKRS